MDKEEEKKPSFCEDVIIDFSTLSDDCNHPYEIKVETEEEGELILPSTSHPGEERDIQVLSSEVSLSNCKSDNSCDSNSCSVTDAKLDDVQDLPGAVSIPSFQSENVSECHSSVVSDTRPDDVQNLSHVHTPNRVNGIYSNHSWMTPDSSVDGNIRDSLCESSLCSVASSSDVASTRNQELNLRDCEAFDNADCNRQICLEMNEKYRSLLNDLRETYEYIHIRNMEKMEQMEKEDKGRNEPNQGINMRRKKRIIPFAHPYFHDTRNRVAPSNEDAITKLKEKTVNAYVGPAKLWSHAEYQQVESAIKVYLLGKSLKEPREIRDEIKKKINRMMIDHEEDDDKKDALNNELTGVENDIAVIKALTLNDLLKIHDGDIDWMLISAYYMGGKRTPEEYEIMWLNYMQPKINRKRFSRDEDDRLRELVEIDGEKDWDVIATQLNTNRTAFQCFQRYQSSLNEEILKSYWTPEEDQKLLDLVEKYKTGDYIPWQKVWCNMERRTVSQLINRWTRTLAPTIKRSVWTREEDALLIACVKKFGEKQWRKISEFLSGRSNYQIRERYMNNLHSNLKVGKWSRTEDRKLVDAVLKYGFGKWSQICAELPGRSDNMCLSRANRFKSYGLLRADVTGYDLDMVRSNQCNSVQNKMETIKSRAMETLMGAAKKICDGNNAVINLETNEISDITLGFLYELKNELLSDKIKSETTSWRPKYFQPQWKSEKHTVSVKKMVPHKRKFQEEMILLSDDDDDIDELQLCDDEEEILEIPSKDDDDNDDYVDDEIDEEEEKEIDNALLLMCLPRSGFTMKNTQKRIIAISAKEECERTVIRDYLCEGYKIPNEDDECESLLREEEKASIIQALQQIVLAVFRDGEMPTLPPNLTSFTGMEMMLSSHHNVLQAASCLRHSRTVLNSIKGADFKCDHCRHNEAIPSSSKFSEIQMESMMKYTNNYFVVDGKLREALEYELECETSEIPESCYCDEVHEWRRQAHNLTKQFTSWFLWPSLLSSSVLHEKQLKAISKRLKSARNKNGNNGNKIQRGRKRKNSRVTKNKAVSNIEIKLEPESGAEEVELGENAQKIVKRRRRRELALEPVRSSTRIASRNEQS